jgi:hypothetical protein
MGLILPTILRREYYAKMSLSAEPGQDAMNGAIAQQA